MTSIGLAFFLLLLPILCLNSATAGIRYGVRKRDRPERYKNIERRKRLGRDSGLERKNRMLQVSLCETILVALDSEDLHAQRCRTKSGCLRSMPKVAARRVQDQAAKLVQEQRLAKLVQELAAKRDQERAEKQDLARQVLARRDQDRAERVTVAESCLVSAGKAMDLLATLKLSMTGKIRMAETRQNPSNLRNLQRRTLQTLHLSVSRNLLTTR